MDIILERDLFEPVRGLLVGLGYDVKGEVKGCDIVAVRDDTLIIVELKRGFNIELLFQATERQKRADSVYVAIPRPKKGYFTRRWRDTLSLAKRLELGIITVAFTDGIPTAEIALHPQEHTVRKQSKKRLAVLEEHASRTGSQNTGGVSRTKLMTVYREQCLQIAAILDVKGELEPKELRELGACGKTTNMLRSNFYGWFEKNEKHYRLSDEGRKALDMYIELANHYKSKLEACE